ncbi:hypothetical protein IU449_26990 [Nocardia higoensis]|uniref:Uncharacterized protein n=1 Tax=Nocardia higoensis TaxID=228599 RepID=A0ABS0DI56_9NOCA|nr:hypothetical protein [Nocardia higoensis]MBF6358147.1 hypothetical protein [Nocardia higoensis]
MTAQTSERVDSIEHLDHTPMCSMARHAGAPTKAAFWLNGHDCHDRLACTACLARNKQRFAQLLDEVGRVGCKHCLKFFSSWDNWCTVVPL